MSFIGPSLIRDSFDSVQSKQKCISDYFDKLYLSIAGGKEGGRKRILLIVQFIVSRDCHRRTDLQTLLSAA